MRTRAEIDADIAKSMALLDQLDAPRQARVASNFASLQAMVAALDQPWAAPVDEEQPAFEARRARPDDVRPDPRPADELPFGVTISEPKAFHPFGSAVRQKLIAEALRKGNW